MCVAWQSKLNNSHKITKNACLRPFIRCRKYQLLYKPPENNIVTVQFHSQQPPALTPPLRGRGKEGTTIPLP